MVKAFDHVYEVHLSWTYLEPRQNMGGFSKSREACTSRGKQSLLSRVLGEESDAATTWDIPACLGSRQRSGFEKPSVAILTN